MALRLVDEYNVGDRIWFVYRNDENLVHTQWSDSDVIDGPYPNIKAAIASTTGEAKTGLLKAFGLDKGLTDE